MVRRAKLTLVGTLVLLVAATLGLGAAPAAHADDVSDWLSFVNNIRAQNGVGPLQISAEESGLAQQRSQINASNNTLVHTSDLTAGVTENWTKLGENIGVGGSTSAIGTAFVNSPSHFANLVEPRYTHIGIGVVWVTDPATGQQTQWVTHRFIAIAGAPSGGTNTTTPGGATTSPTPPITQAPRPKVTAPPVTTAPVTTQPPITEPSAPPPTAPPVATPADSDRVSAVLDALHQLDR
jgi:hypothetical protein